MFDSVRRMVLVAVVVTASVAHAGDRVVFESYTGARPANASELLSALLDELATKGFDSGPDAVGRKVEKRVSRAGVTLTGLPDDFGEQIERGHRAWISGKYDESVGILNPLVELAHANTGAFATNQSLRDRMVKALIALALSQHRLGDPGAAEQTFGELLRSFPEAQVARGTYGPEANALYEQIKTKLLAKRRGRLLVKLTNEQAQVFINERLERRGTTVKELLPGEYRVVVQFGSVQSRNHRVEVKPDEDTTITIDLAFDAVVRSTPWTGLEFETSADREKLEASYVSQLASAIDAKAVVVVGIDSVRGRPSIVGALVSTTTRREIRRASLALEPPPASERLRALARFLAGEEATAGIDVQLDAEAGLVPGAGEPTSTRRWRGYTVIAGTAAIVGLGAGAVLLALDGRCPTETSLPTCPDVYATAAPGWISVGAGAVLAGITIYLMVNTGETKPPARTAYVVPTAGGAVAGFTMRF